MVVWIQDSYLNCSFFSEEMNGCLTSFVGYRPKNPDNYLRSCESRFFR